MSKKGLPVSKDTSQFIGVFLKCCQSYDELNMFVAWVGDPANNIPFSYLQELKSVSITLGISFCQSHPDGIEHLMKLDKNMRIMNEQPLFHPKVYIFSKGKQKALVIGSSNFTYSGFCENIEMNILLEGPEYQNLIVEKEAELNQWRSREYSVKPTKEWLEDYRVKYMKRQEKLKEAKVKDEATKEQEYAFSNSWINKISWDEYYKQLNKVIADKGYKDTVPTVIKQKVQRLSTYKKELSIPWELSYFNDSEKRKMMWGQKPYWWLGYVGASGKNKSIIKSGTIAQKGKIIKAINIIAEQNKPVDWAVVRKQLLILEGLGPTIKFWSRFLAITRPDLFCTFSSDALRGYLSETLGVTKSYLSSVDGYISFVQMIHNAPWFKSPRPQKKQEAVVWENRGAFLDEFFHH